MKKIPLIMSLIVNILLVAAVFAVRLHYHKMIFQALYNFTTSEVRFHEGVLAELQSEDEYKIKAVKAMLEQNIKQQKEFAEIWKAASERMRLR
jgi:hypothetical protein